MVAEIERALQVADEQPETWREIGQHLQNVRSRLDEPFAVVASRADIRPTDLAAIERGEARPTGKDLQSLFAALKISRVGFVGGLSSAARKLVMELFEPELEESVQVVENNTDSISLKNHAVMSARPKRSPKGWGIAREEGQITYYQMHACLRGLFKRTDREKAEIIYSWTSPADIDVKVFTSVDARTGLARPIGEDAIRIVVYDKRAKRKIVSWSVELKRTGN